MYHSEKMNWEEDCKRICTREERKEIVWWRVGVWRLKELRRGLEIGMCKIYKKGKTCGRIRMLASKEMEKKL
jgi:hypothetical protein